LNEENKLVLTDSERKLILAVRATNVKNGRIPCVIFVQDGKLIRSEFKERIRSERLS